MRQKGKWGWGLQEEFLCLMKGERAILGQALPLLSFWRCYLWLSRWATETRGSRVRVKSTAGLWLAGRSWESHSIFLPHLQCENNNGTFLIGLSSRSNEWMHECLKWFHSSCTWWTLDTWQLLPFLKICIYFWLCRVLVVGLCPFVTCRLGTFPKVCEISVPQLGIKPGFPCTARQVLNH